MDTTYSTMAKKNPYPVDAKLAKQAVDPLDTIPNVDLSVQCTDLGYELSDLFDDSELENLPKTDKKPRKGKTESNVHDASPEAEGEISIGSAVHYEKETDVCFVKSIDGNEVEIEDESGEVFEVDLTDLTLVEEPEPAKTKKKVSKKKTSKKKVVEKDKTIKVGSMVNYLDENGACTVKSIKGDDVVIEDGNGDQFDVLMGDLVLDEIPF